MAKVEEEPGSRRALSGQVALVTGAAVRVGREIALTLAAEGADVVIHYRRSEREAAELCAELSRRGAGAWMIRADLDDPDQAEKLIDGTLENASRLDILINSASIFPVSRLSTLDLDSLLQSIRIHAWAPLVLSRKMGATASQGSIVNLLDSGLVGYDREHAGYAIGKLVLSHLTRVLALEMAPRFTVNAVAPGPVLPPVGQGEGYLESRARELPLQRVGSPRDIARAVAFLVESPFITGQTIFVDGGGHLR